MTYGIGNPGHDLGQPKILCGRFKQVNVIPTLFIIGSSSTIQKKQTIKTTTYSPPLEKTAQKKAQYHKNKQQQKHVQYNSRV